MTQTPVNTRRGDQGATATTDYTDEGTGKATISQHMPPVYQSKHYEVNLQETRGTVATSMRKITTETQRKNAGDILNLMNTQGGDPQDINEEENLFTEQLESPVTQKVKVVYLMGPGTARIGQKLPITNKTLMLYGEGGTAIGLSHTLVLDATVRDKVLVKNLTPEDVQASFTNGHAVDKKTERANNTTKEE